MSSPVLFILPGLLVTGGATCWLLMRRVDGWFFVAGLAVCVASLAAALVLAQSDRPSCGREIASDIGCTGSAVGWLFIFVLNGVYGVLTVALLLVTTALGRLASMRRSP